MSVLKKYQPYCRILLRLLLFLLVVNAVGALTIHFGNAESSGLPPIKASLFTLCSPHDVWQALPALGWRGAGILACVFLALGGIVLFMRFGASCAILLALLLIWGTLNSTGADLAGDIGAGNLPLMLGAALCFGTAIVLGAIRWGVLLRVQTIHLSLPTLLRLTFMGHFFNISLPGAVMGDVIKVGYATEHTEDHKAEAVLTILLDRVIGIIGLCIIASAVVLWRLPALLQLPPEFRNLKMAAAIVALGSIGGLVFVLLVEFRERLMRIALVAKLVDLGAETLPGKLVEIISRFTKALELYRNYKLATAKAILLAVCVHTMLGFGLYCAGKGVGEQNVGICDYFLAAQVANTVAAIPLTPGGVGTRDFVAKEYLRAFGAEPASKIGSIPVILTLGIVFWGLVGALVFILSPRRKSCAATDEPDKPS